MRCWTIVDRSSGKIVERWGKPRYYLTETQAFRAYNELCQAILSFICFYKVKEVEYDLG